MTYLVLLTVSVSSKREMEDLGGDRRHSDVKDYVYEIGVTGVVEIIVLLGSLLYFVWEVQVKGWIHAPFFRLEPPVGGLYTDRNCRNWRKYGADRCVPTPWRFRRPYLVYIRDHRYRIWRKYAALANPCFPNLLQKIRTEWNSYPTAEWFFSLVMLSTCLTSTVGLQPFVFTGPRMYAGGSGEGARLPINLGLCTEFICN